MNESLTPSDVALLSNNNDMWGGGGAFFWVFALLLLNNANQSQYLLGQLGRFVAWTPSGTQAANVTAG